MKAIRIILLILIIIGLGFLATQKIWVPKLVDHIISAEQDDRRVPPTEPAQENLTLVDGRQCYIFSHEIIAEAPYKVSEFVDITITGAKVEGTKRGSQAGPDMTNGYQGTISGNLENNTITDIFAYTIEGSKNKEKEIYRTNKVGLEKLRYPLKEEGGMLVPDTTKEFTAMTYARVGCTASN
jgi:hypothetical protein